MIRRSWPTLVLLLTIWIPTVFSPRSIGATEAPSSYPETWTVHSEIALARYPTGIAVDAESLWIAAGKQLLRVELDTSRTTARIPLDCKPDRVVAVRGAVLVACALKKVLVIEPSSDEITRTLRVDGEVIDLTRGGGFVWILHPLGKISRLDPANLEEVHTLKIAGKGWSMNHSGLAYLDDTLWILNSKRGNLFGVDPTSGEITHAPVDFEKGVVRVVAGLEALWLVNNLESKVTRFDPDTGEFNAPIPVGESPTDGALFEGAIWIVSANSRSLTRIELGSRATTTHTIPGQNRPIAVQGAHDALWVSTIDDYRVLELRPAAAENATSGEAIGSSLGPECRSGPEYDDDMLEEKCDSAPALTNPPPGRVAAVTAAGDDSWFFAGSTENPSPSLFLIRGNSMRSVDLDVRFAQSSEARSVDVAVLDGGDAVVIGDIRDDEESPWETLLARIDAHGDLIWEHRHPAPGASRLVNQIASLPVGSFAIAGSVVSDPPSVHRHGFISRFAQDGSLVWETEITDVEGIDRLAISEAEVAAVGPPQGQVSLQFVRLDLSGKRLGSVMATTENVQATDLVALKDGGWAVVGDPGVWSGRGHLQRLDAVGRPLWCRYLGSGDAYRWGWRLLPLEDGSLLAAGTPRYYVSFGGQKGFLYLAQISANGELVEEHVHTGFASHESLGVFALRQAGYALFISGNWTGPTGQKLVRAYERPKRRYSGSLRKTRMILLDHRGRVITPKP